MQSPAAPAPDPSPPAFGFAPLLLQRPEGPIAYSDSGGDGRAVVCVPGIGDVRQSFRLLAPQLIAAGFRVIAVDLRGHGASGVGFADVGAAAVGGDLVALLDALDLTDSLVVGNSAGAAAAVWAAAERPQRVAGLALLGPFVRDVPLDLTQRLLLALMLTVLLRRPWGPRLWGAYYRSLFVGHPPADLGAYAAALVRNLQEPGRFEALHGMMAASKADCAARLPAVRAPTVVLMGAADPDFKDPAGEANFVATALRGRATVVPGVGHYPHGERPELVVEALVGLRGEGGRPA